MRPKNWYLWSGEWRSTTCPINTGQEVWKSLNASLLPPSHTVAKLVTRALSVQTHGGGWWRFEDGTEHICHLFAGHKKMNSMRRNASPRVLLTTPIPKRGSRHRGKSNAKQRGKWVRQKKKGQVGLRHDRGKSIKAWLGSVGIRRSRSPSQWREAEGPCSAALNLAKANSCGANTIRSRMS